MRRTLSADAWEHASALNTVLDMQPLEEALGLASGMETQRVVVAGGRVASRARISPDDFLTVNRLVL